MEAVWGTCGERETWQAAPKKWGEHLPCIYFNSEGYIGGNFKSQLLHNFHEYV